MALVEHGKNNAERPPSPNASCAICLGEIRNFSRPTACQHTFCFDCLLEWSHVKYECPLCKTNFISITQSGGNVHVLPDRNTVYEQNLSAIGEVIITAVSASSIFTGNLIRFRQFIYYEGRRAMIRSRVVYCPNIYRVQPLQIARLRPWLQREVMALRPNRWMMIFGFLLEAIQNYSLDDDRFNTVVAEFLAESAHHFRHELRLFSASYYDMHGWDMNAQYSVTALPQYRNSSISVDLAATEDNDVQIVEERNPSIEILTTPVEVITVSDTENVEVIEIDSDNGQHEASDPNDSSYRVDSPSSSGSSLVPPASEPSHSSTSRRKRRKRVSPRIKRHSTPVPTRETNDETEADTDGSVRHSRSRARRSQSTSRRYRDKRNSHHRRHRDVPSEDSSDSDNVPVQRHSSSSKLRSVRSVVVVPSRRS